ncbi:MAG: murein biosynthesis integral membrane protein MurJ [Candidatus Berkelbacteria bacterium]|nr:murein biosynthesis integral membrane protein MurJ [Candidatus Berkelbacteria bacterium]
MWKRFQNFIHRENSLIGAAGVLIVTMALSNILGLLRDHYLARNIATADLDIYYAAFRIPDLIFNILIFGAISAAFIPVFTEYVTKGDKKDAFKLANSLISIGAAGLIVLAIVLYFLMPQLSHLIVPDFDSFRMEKTVQLSRILLLTPIFFSISYFVGGMLNSFKRFIAYSFAPIVYNLSIIIAAVFFAGNFGVVAVAWFVVIGAFMHMLVQVPTAMKLGWRYHSVFNFRDSGVKKVFRLMIPRAIGMGANNILLVVYTALASALAAGSIAVFNLANNIQTMPTVVFATSFSTAIFPTLAHRASIGDHESFSSYLTRSMRVIIYLLAPSTVIFILLRAQIIRLILGSGKFNWTDTRMAALTLGWFSFSLVAQGLIPLFAKAFYARHDTKTPTIISVASIIVSIAIAYPLSKSMGVAGLALSFSIGSYLNALALYIWLYKLVPKIFNTEIIWSTLKIIFASFVMAAVVRYFGHYLYNYFNMLKFFGVLGQAAVTIIVGLMVYIIITYLFGCEELTWAIKRRVNVKAESST